MNIKYNKTQKADIHSITKRTNALSDREMEVLYYIALENTNADIAKKLFLSKGTVATYRNNILTKLSTKNSAGMIRTAVEIGLLKLDENNKIIPNQNHRKPYP